MIRKIKKFLIGLGIAIVAFFGLTDGPVKDAVVGGFSNVRGVVNLQSDPILSAIVTLSSSSYATLHTTSVTLLAAPGSGRVNELVAVTVARDFSSESWNRNLAQAPTIGFASNVTLGPAITASLSNGLFTGGAVWTQVSPSYVTVYPADHIATSSAIILRRVGSATPTIDGDTSFKFFIFYKTLTLP